jgi:hypothetical protein
MFPEHSMKSTSHLAPIMACILLSTSGCVDAGEVIPPPIDGDYASRNSVAREQTAPEQWRDIQQEVRMRETRDAEIIELRLEIDVHMAEDNDGPSLYTIANRMWLAGRAEQIPEEGTDRVDFDVYKLNPLTARFDDQGDGYCEQD